MPVMVCPEYEYAIDFCAPMFARACACWAVVNACEVVARILLIGSVIL